MTSKESNSQNPYGIGYREETTTRLFMRGADTHARFFLPYLKPGFNLLDAGCGPGVITSDLARIVDPGEVVGVDVEKTQVEKAESHAVEQGVGNVRFQTASIYDLPFPDEKFDAVFSHAVMEHLDNPDKAIIELKRVLKSGGVLGIRCGDMGAFMVSPDDPVLNRMFELWEKVYWHHGRDPRFGRNLLAALRKAGFSDIESSSSSDMWTGSQESKLAHVEVVATICEDSWFAEQAVELGFANRNALDQIAAAWRSLVDDPNAFVSEARGEAVAWKE